MAELLDQLSQHLYRPWNREEEADQKSRYEQARLDEEVGLDAPAGHGPAPCRGVFCHGPYLPITEAWYHRLRWPICREVKLSGGIRIKRFRRTFLNLYAPGSGGVGPHEIVA